MDIIKIPNSKEITEFANKYSYAVKEVKNNIIELIEFNNFINSNEWKNLSENERYIFLETLKNLNTTDNILQNNVISIENNQKDGRWNYGDYEYLIKEYLNYKPININEFAKEYPFLVNKVENEILYLNDFDNVINSDIWQNLTYETQTKILGILNRKIIDTERKKRYDESKKKYAEYHKLKYEFPKTIINCNYLSEKWIDIDNIYGFYNVVILKERTETKKEQIKHLKKELIRLYEINKTEYIGLIKKTEKELYLLGAKKEVKSIRKEFKNTLEKQNIKHLKLPKQTNFYNTILTKTQTSLLAYYLRKHKFILQNTTDTLLSDCFGKMTGFAKTQINKDYKGLTNIIDISDRKKDYETLIDSLKILITDIESYKQENEKIKNLK